jgi:tripartite-type tricarboxylate transporter receptor subunit TctC
MMAIRPFLWAVAGAAALLAGQQAQAQAQDYPSRPITLIVPFTAGGGTDTFGRILGGKLQERLGQTVVVENRAGAGGNIGAALAAKARPDGYTLVVVQNGVTINPWLHKDMPFDIEKDLTPVGIYTHLPMVVAVHPGLPVNTIGELISYSKENAGKVFYATPGVGTPQHLATELFIGMTGAKMNHVPYKGATDLFPDIVSGRSHVMFGVLSSTAPFINDKKLRALATGGKSRTTTMFSNLPTVAETVPGYEFSVWFGIMATAGTPQPVIEKLSAAFQEVVRLPDVRERLMALGYEPVAVTPAQMGQVIRSDLAQWGELTRKLGMAVR